MVYHSLFQALASKEREFAGEKTSENDSLALRKALGDKVPDWYFEITSKYALCGTAFFLDAEKDLSGLGVDLGWMKPTHIIEEALSAEPGKSVLPLGYLPFGHDLSGGGDPYFLRLTDDSEDPAVVRIPHESAVHTPYPLADVEEVSSKLSQFIVSSSILAGY